MARRATLEAVILRTIDVGEADRLCILFTREEGRKAAKARGVRKTASRLGGTLLPFRHTRVDISESETHSAITGAVDCADLPDVLGNFEAFLRLQQGVELLLALTEDNEPIPGVFDLLLQFIALADNPSALLPFQLRLLHLLGFMPEHDVDSRYRSLSAQAKAYVLACTRMTDLAQLCTLLPEGEELGRYMSIVSGEQLQRPLRSLDFNGPRRG